MTNRVLDTDSYKLSHFLQYPPETTEVSSYIEPRGGDLDSIVFFGLQSWLKTALGSPIRLDEVEQAERLANAHIGVFNRAGWDHILEAHNGWLPVEIQALPEGSLITPGTPVVQIRNTDPECFWLTSYLETALLRAVWYPSTVASISHACRDVLLKYLDQTCDEPASVLPFQLHDFGARGATSEQSAGLGGLAHLINFQGTDTLSALIVGHRDYGIDLAGISIPAAEHSTMTSWTQSKEADAYANMIEQFGKPGAMVAIVADSYDLYHAVDELFGQQLKATIEDCGGRVVVRPDSGHPADIVPEVISRLMARFGARTNAKGYKVLPDCIRIIQGDGVTLESLPEILEAIKQRGLSTENAAFGMGGGLLQKLDRDTCQWAMKTCEVVTAGQRLDVFKQPSTDPTKRSKPGRQAVAEIDGRLQAIREDQLSQQDNRLRPVWRNGQLLIDESFDQIRQRAQAASSQQEVT